MTNKQKLWSIFGPVLIAAGLALVVFAIPWKSNNSPATLQKAAVSLSPNVFKNRAIKVQALADKKANYVPFFGSSEFNRMDRYYPATMAAKYHHYRPFMFGSRGTQSLPQLFNMTMMAPQMKNKKAVFVISPQWFVKKGVMPDAFRYYNGTYANLVWLAQANPKSPYDRYTAKRLGELTSDSGTVASYAYKIERGEQLNAFERTNIKVRIALLAHEDNLFSGFFLKDNYQKRIQPREKLLPKRYDYDRLYAQAVKAHAKATNNNDLGVLNSFYDQRIKHAKHIDGSQKHFSYLKSPEYADLQVVLNQLKKTNTNVVFMITPVNTKWEQKTGLNMQMYYQTAKKIKFQLQAQGFNHIIDYSHAGSKPGFMNDTIHIGWAGWVDFDHRIAPFLDNPQPAPDYHMNEAFLSTEWQNLTPTTTNLQQFKAQHLK